MSMSDALVDGAQVQKVDPEVELYANNLHNPSHMEWAGDGRLLVSERGSGVIKAVSGGGDMANEEPFATDLEGPTRLQPLGNGRLMAVEMHEGTIKEISDGGDVSDVDPYVEGLDEPYSLVAAMHDGEQRLYVTENDGVHTRIRDVTGGGHADELPVAFDELPTQQGQPGYSRITDDWSDDWMKEAGDYCNTWLTAHGEKLYASVSVKGDVLDLSGAEHGQTYADLVNDGRRIMRGRERLGGLKYNPIDDRIYGVEPERGEVFVADPDETANHQFRPGIVRGLGHPSCLRFSEDNEAMFVCGLGHGVIWKVTNFR